LIQRGLCDKSKIIYHQSPVDSARSQKGGRLLFLPYGLLVGPVVLVLLAVSAEEHLLSVDEIAEELGLTFCGSLFARCDVLLGVIADAEHDVLELLRHVLDVLQGLIVSRPQVDIDDETIVGVSAFDVQQDDLCSVLHRDRLRSEVHIHATESLEVHGTDVVAVTVLGKFDVCHDCKYLRVKQIVLKRDGGIPHAYELGVGVERCTSSSHGYSKFF